MNIQFMYCGDTNVQPTPRCRFALTRYGKDMAQMALAFVLANPVVTSVIIGTTSMKHIQHNLAALKITPTEDHLAACDDIWKRLRPLTFFYGR